MACCQATADTTTDRKIYDQSASHSARDPFVIGADKIMNSLLLAAVRIIMAMQTKYACFLTIAVMSLIIKLICFFIEQALVWIYTFTSFGVLLVGFLLGIASTTALAVYNTFLWFFVLLACVFITFAAISVWLNPNDLRTGEYIRAISVSHMIAYFYF